MQRFCIQQSAKILNALIQLNNLHSYAMTLFVIDDKGRMIGTLTDGDIRRALISGKGLDSCVSEAMHTSFSAIHDPNDIKAIKKLRESNIILVPLLDRNDHIIEVLDLSANLSALPIDAVLMAGGKGV